MNKLPKRQEMKKEDCWAIEDLFADDKAWENEFLKLEHDMKDLEKYRGKLGDSSGTVLELFQLDDQLSIMGERVYVYANQKSHEDMSNSKYQDLASKAHSLIVKKDTLSSFIVPEILAIPDEKLAGFLDENIELQKYEKLLKDIVRQKKHILSHEMESVLADVQEVAESSRDVFTMFNNADLKFPNIKNDAGEQVELTHGRFVTLMENQDRRVRKETFEALYDSYSKYKNTLSASFRGNVKQFCFFARTRKYESSLEYALDGGNIPVDVYKKLIETVNKSLPLLHQYVALRKNELGVDELHMYDLYVPIVKDIDKKISFDQAKEIVLKGLAPLGEEYLNLLQEGFKQRWIDVYENEGKRSGAYSWGAYGTHPYVLLNHQDNLNSVFTLAHEMGHALHSYYSDESMDYIYAGYKIFVAEVASTCNEALLIHYLLENCSNKDEKKYLINYFLEQFRGTLFRQTMFAEFEKITHSMVESGEVLTAENLSSIYLELNKKYYGNEMIVDDKVAMEWARIPHFYTPFYVYQYATGFSAAIAISSKILEGDQKTIDGYKKFLRSGSSLDPIDLLKLCGVDMTTTEPVENAMRLFGELLDKFYE